MNASLEHIYETHHATRRGERFELLGDVRGAFLKEAVGTGKHVLDIGCRDGALTKFFAEGNTVLGVDIDTKALARAHESLGIETKHIDLNGEWPLEDPTHINHFTVRELQGLLEQKFTDVKVVGFGRLGWLARTFPQTFAFGFLFCAGISNKEEES